MKRIGYLFEKIIAIDNITLAIRNATKHKKRKRGLVKRVARNPHEFAPIIKEMLESGEYKFSPPINIQRRERKKVRNIKVPKFFPDQVIHWALMQVIDPIINRGMDRYCCGSVKDRGTSAAKKAIDHFLKSDPKIKYVFKADIRHFFESVNCELLKEKFRRVIKDAKVLKLIDDILDNGGDGLPIGYYTSQGFSNFYLQKADHEIKEKLRIRHLVRYADDLVCLDTNKRKLHKAKVHLDGFLGLENLKLKDDWQIWKHYSRPIDFVGYRFYKGYTLLRKTAFYSLTRSVRKIEKYGLTPRQAKRFISYMGRAKCINFKNFYLKFIKKIISKGQAQRYISKYEKSHRLRLNIGGLIC